MCLSLLLLLLFLLVFVCLFVCWGGGGEERRGGSVFECEKDHLNLVHIHACASEMSACDFTNLGA